jgi:hypothetical protein
MSTNFDFNDGNVPVSSHPLSHESFNQNSMQSLQALFIAELEKIAHGVNSNTEAERIANLITLGVIDEAFWSYLLKAHNGVITRAIAFRAFLSANVENPIPVFISKLNGYRLCVLTSQNPAQAMEYFCEDGRVGVRCFVAQNPETPAGVLEKLAQDKSFRVRQTVTENSNTPMTVLERLKSDFSPSDTRNAPNKKIVENNLKILEWLIAEQLSIEAQNNRQSIPFIFLGTNSNLRQIGLKDTKHWLFVLENLQESITTLEKDKNGTRLPLIQNPQTSISIIEQLARDEDTNIRCAITKLYELPINILEQLGGDDNYKVRRAVAGNSNTPITVLEALAKDSDWSVRIEVAKNPQTPIATLKKFAKYKEIEIRIAVAKNPSTPHTVLEDLAKEKYVHLGLLENVHVAVTNNPSTPHTVLEAIAKKYMHLGLANNLLLVALANNRNTPISVLEELAKDRDFWVRTKVARNPQTPIAILKKFAKYKESSMRLALAYNPNTPLALLEVLARDEDKGVRFNVASNSNTPITVLEALAKDRDCSIRYNIAKNPNTPKAMLIRLLSDNELSVRCAVVSNPSIPIDILIELSQDENSAIRSAVAANFQTPTDIFNSLSKDMDGDVRYSVHKNPLVPKKIQETLISDDYVLFRRLLESNPMASIHCALASNILAPVPLLEHLAKDEFPTVRSTVATHPDTPVSLLKLLIQDQNTKVKSDARLGLAMAILAGNTNSQIEDVLENLAQDTRPIAHCAIAAVARNPETPVHILEFLLQDTTNSEVLASVVGNPKTPTAAIEKKRIDLITQYASSKNNLLSRLFSLLDRRVPLELLLNRQNSLNWHQRYAVAQNLSVPPKILQELTKDKHYLVRLTAKEQITTAGC